MDIIKSPYNSIFDFTAKSSVMNTGVITKVLCIWACTKQPCEAINIGIKHGFSCINVCQVPREMLKAEAEGRGFQQSPRDLANVNALENNV